MRLFGQFGYPHVINGGMGQRCTRRGAAPTCARVLMKLYQSIKRDKI